MPPELRTDDDTDTSYEDAFKEALGSDDVDVDDPPADEGEQAGGAEGEGEQADEAEGEQAGEDTGEQAGEDTGEQAGEGEKPAEGEKSGDRNEILQQLLEIARQREASKTAQPEQEQTQQTQQTQQEQTQQEEQPFFTEDEQKLLNGYEQDWPDVSKAEALKRRYEYRQLMEYMLSEVQKQLNPVAETVQTLAQDHHLNQLYSRVEDYDDVRDGVVEWVEQQPDYLQDAYKRVINEGTADQVADLINRYKSETGQAEQAAPEPAQKEAELPTATKKAAAALAPVSSKKTSAAPSGVSKDDFDAAFAAFAEKGQF